jgi:TonB family protein
VDKRGERSASRTPVSPKPVATATRSAAQASAAAGNDAGLSMLETPRVANEAQVYQPAVVMSRIEATQVPAQRPLSQTASQVLAPLPQPVVLEVGRVESSPVDSQPFGKSPAVVEAMPTPMLVGAESPVVGPAALSVGKTLAAAAVPAPAVVLNAIDLTPPDLAHVNCVSRGCNDIITVHFVVQKDGNVARLALGRRSTNLLLNESVLAAASKWRYAPIAEDTPQLVTLRLERK